MSKVIVELDALLVVSSLCSPGSLSAYDLVISDCIALSNYFTSISFRFVKRSANELAHHFAQSVRSSAGLVVWLVPLFDVFTILASDSLL